MDNKITYIFDDAFKTSLLNQQNKIKIIFFSSLFVLVIEAILVALLYTLEVHLIWLLLTLFLYLMLGWINLYMFIAHYIANRKLLQYMARLSKQHPNIIIVDQIDIKPNTMMINGFSCHQVTCQMPAQTRIVYVINQADLSVTNNVKLHIIDHMIVAYEGSDNHA